MMPDSNKQNTYAFTISLPLLGRVPLHPKDIWNDLIRREEAPLWAQIFKYGIFGILSLFILMGFVYSAQLLWPEYLDHKKLAVPTMQLHMTIILAAAFIPTNLFSYITNRLFVFTPGKHSLANELILFTLISFVSFVGGEIGKRIIIEQGYSPMLATICFAFSAALVNFIARKVIIFKN